MIEKTHIVTCDICGREDYFHGTKNEALRSYARRFYLYKLVPVSPLADELWKRSKHCVSEYLMFCSELCAENYFDDNPEDVAHYKLVKTRK